ncbi:hypothetical protein [Apilactobacillus xinyiensis]|uniref:S-layer protein n=1 Tax=Apilactobacillus xinyiensis TaxID=2841032 RepID=A0ABT0I3B3_9LACO|nr:hypothetical protein [Apilactobacillus xinyiensis]MCK8625184.1 hypothetical protein [Apilactobacillus xinyiensis]
MQKSLKKSLYLGLAALSFASVAGATNANAAKKHHSKKTVKTVKKAKPVTYTSSYNLDQSVVYSLNGNNAIYTKPGTVKGARVVASKSDVKSVANSSKGYFMAYGEAKTSKGVHYYKVVSFDHKYRGWVYAGSAKKVDSTTTATDTPKNNVVYLKSNVSNTLWDAPKYSAFKTTKAANNNSGIANDQYVVDKAVKLNREGWTYYHVTNKTNANYNGWVWAGATNDAAPTDNFNAAKDIKVNFTYNGSQVKSAVFHAYDFNLRMNNGLPYNSTDLNKALFNKTALAQYSHAQNGNLGWLGSQLKDTGYTLAGLTGGDLFKDNADNTLSFTPNTNNSDKLKGVKAGDTIWLDVVKDNSKVSSKFKPVVLNNNFSAYTGTEITNYIKPSLKDNVAEFFTNPKKPLDSQKHTADAYYGSLFDNTLATAKNVVNPNNSTLSFLLGNANSTYLDASSTKTVYKSDADAAKAFQLALRHDNVTVTVAKNSAVTADIKPYGGTDTYSVTGHDINGNEISPMTVVVNSNNQVVASGNNGSNLKAVSGTPTLNDYLNANNMYASDQPYGSVDDFAGLNSNKNTPFGNFDVDNNGKGTFTVREQGGSGQQSHFVYFLANTNDLKYKSMGQDVTPYYYAVPVAGTSVDRSNGSTTNY